jgi:hypothetical protein
VNNGQVDTVVINHIGRVHRKIPGSVRDRAHVGSAESLFEVV